MSTVIIGSVSYEVYADISEADEYFNGSSDYATWAAFSAEDKARSLVTATRLLDRQKWQGQPASDLQPLAWPRDGAVDCNGNAIPSDTIPPQVIEASMILALYEATGSDVQTAATTESLTQSLKAGSVAISYFRGDRNDYSRFPLPVMELVGCFFAGASGAIGGSLSFGTDGQAYDNDFGLNEGF